MRFLFKCILFFFVFSNVIVVGAENFQQLSTKHVVQHFSALPQWCQRDLFLTTGEGTVSHAYLPLVSDTSLAHDTYLVEIIYTAKKRVSQVRLINDTRKCVEGSIIAHWNGEALSSVQVKDESGNVVVSYRLSYDEEEAVASTILEGNLTGEGQVEQYETKCYFDEQGRVTQEWEQNGKVIQYIYPKSETDYFVVITSYAGTYIRNAGRSSSVGFEEIIDDGCSEDINNLDKVTKRKFRILLEGSESDTMTIGAWDIAEKKPILLRRTEVAHNSSEQKIRVFDGNNDLISYAKGNDDSFFFSDSSKNEQQFIDGLGRLRVIQNASSEIFSETTRKYDLFGNIVSEKKSAQEPISIEYTARGQPSLITFPDGSKETHKYSLDGFEVEHTYCDGYVEKWQKDALGRVLEETKDSITVYYTYQGLDCSQIRKLQESFSYKRDLFGRVVEVRCSNGVTYHISYDALDRIIEVQAVSKNSWIWTKSFSVDGLETTTSLKYDRDPSSYIVTAISRANGRLASKSERIGTECFFYEYDEQGRILSVDHEKDGVKHQALRKIYAAQTSSQASEWAEKTTTVFPDGSSLIEKSTAGGNRNKTWLDAESNEVLVEDFEKTDAKGSMRLTQKVLSKERTIEWQFGANKRLSSVKIGGRGTEYTYDTQGRLITKKTPLSILHYKYVDSNLVSLESEDGSIKYQFAYDAQGRMVQMLDAIASKQVVRSFDEAGRLESDGEEGRTCFLSYGKDGKISSIRLPDGSSFSYEQTEKGVCVRREAWVMEKEKEEGSCVPNCCKPIKVTKKDRLGEWTQEFSYDSLNQLSGEKGEFTERYSFTPFGTIASKDGIASTYNEHNEPITFGEATLSYDEEGNIILQEVQGTKKEFFYDALGRVSSVRCGRDEERYRYDALSRLQEISFFQNGFCKERKELLWIGLHEIGSMQDDLLTELKIPDFQWKKTLGIELKGKIFDVDCDERGSIVALLDQGNLVQVFRYSAFGTLHAYDANGEETTPITPWRYSAKRWLEGAQLYNFGHRRYDPYMMRWCEKDPLGMVDGCDDRMFVRNNPVYFQDAEGLFAFPVSWSSLKEGISQAFHKITSSVWKSVTLTKNELDWFCELKDEFEEIAFRVIGQNWTRLIGYNPDISMEAVCGSEEKHPKARITFINGILNWSCDTAKSAEMVSKAHGDNAVHYIYAATHGFTNDLVRGFIAQVKVTSQQAVLLANMWKRLLDEMGGVESGGVILHYAHSLGATDTYNALQLLTPAERNCIRVTTVGGSTMIQEGICAKSDNYVSAKDGVPILDLGHYVRSSFGKMPNVHFLPSDSSPFLDHGFQGKTYSTIIEILGQQFQEQYLLST